jgi:hypothetical protein
MKKIDLTNGGQVVVDDDDYEFMSQFKWRGKFADGTNHRHAVRDVNLGTKRVTIRMHRLITEASTESIVHHVNGDSLDNRKRNLQARQIRPWTARADRSAFRGVDQVSGSQWAAQISFAGRKYRLGSFSNSTTAAKAYDSAARNLYGHNARTNFS